jgi:formamidopyrimidine-DNA glycosylase
MSGQLLHVADPTLPELPHTHVVARLDDGSELRFVDPRTFGEWYVTDDVGSGGLPTDFDRFGPDPLLDGLPASRLREVLKGRRSPIKAALTDQRVLAGVGNLYADEVCFLARVRPDRRCDTLTDDEVRRLASAIRRILGDAVKLRGSSLRDARYRDLMGDLGGYQRRHRVYERAGEPCVRCGWRVSKIGFGARVAYCCEHCQQ